MVYFNPVLKKKLYGNKQLFILKVNLSSNTTIVEINILNVRI